MAAGAPAKPAFQVTAEQFRDVYVRCMKDRAQAPSIARIYDDAVLVTNDGANVSGKAKATEALAAKVATGGWDLVISSTSAHPLGGGGGPPVVLMTGNASKGGKTIQFQEAVCLQPAAGGIRILNDIFRCNPASNPMNHVIGGDAVKQFVDAYHVTLGKPAAERAGIFARIYAPDALLTYESTMAAGHAKIAEAFVRFPPSRIRCNTIDVHTVRPAGTVPDGSVMALISGQVLIEGESNPLNFAQLMVIKKRDAAQPMTLPNMLIAHDIFRFNYG